MPLLEDHHNANLTRLRQTIIFICCLLLGCEYAESGQSSQRSIAAIDSASERIKAVTLDAREIPSDSTLKAIRGIGATHLTLISFGFQPAADDPQIRFSPDVRWYSESAAGAHDLSERASELGMGIILKPQIWLRGGAWTADIDFTSEKAWKHWESNYRAYLMHCARLAQAIGADVLVVGTELSNPVQERPAFWRALIEDVRGVYDGKLTYAANWHEDYDRVSFWDVLDFIGVQAYFPLSSEVNPSIEQLRKGWADHLDALQTVSEKENLPVLFTELGYRSVPYAAEEPWRWPTRDEAVDPDYELQADLYRVFFETVWSQPWFAGVLIWKFYPESGRPHGRALDFTPQGKPAEEVIRARWRP